MTEEEKAAVVRKVTVTLTLDAAVLNRARTESDAAHRSLSNYIEWILKRLYEPAG